MSHSRNYTIQLTRPMLVLSPEGKMKAITELKVSVLGEDPYRAPELDVANVMFRTAEDGDLFALHGKADPV
jgi:hypothetical protein